LHAFLTSPYKFILLTEILTICRSQWPSCLRHVPSSAALTLVLWVRIPLEVWMCVLAFLCCVVLCAGRGLASGRSPVQGVLPTAQIDSYVSENKF
jgi:hypothetical protein